MIYLSRIKDINNWRKYNMTTWAVDQSHSEISFEVKHMMVSKVKGRFNTYEATVEADDLLDLTNAKIGFVFDANSVDTRSEDRDNHMRGADFFDVENYPTVNFTSTHIEKDGDEYKVSGDLTIKDVTKTVTFDVEFNGKGKNPWGVEVYGFEAETKINREEFGLTWNAALETGGVLVGKDIKIKVELELNPQA